MSGILKMVMVGAKVVMMASALYQNGIEHIRTVLEGMEAWMERREYESVEQMRGSMSHSKSPDPGAFERAHYLKALNTFDAS